MGIMGITKGGGVTMDMMDKTPEIEALEKEIALLPAGNITTKRVRGKE